MLLAGKGAIKYDCSDYNYQSVEMNSEEIATFCNSKDYKQRALFKRNTFDVNKDTPLKNQSNLDYTIYPNPNDGIFELQFTTSDGVIVLEVLDAFGRVILEAIKPEESDKASIDISSEKSGIYFIRIVGNSNPNLTKRVVRY